MNSGVLQLDQRMSILPTMNKHRLIYFIIYFISLIYIATDQRKLLIVIRSVLYVKFKETNQIWSPLKIAQ